VGVVAWLLCAQVGGLSLEPVLLYTFDNKFAIGRSMDTSDYNPYKNLGYQAEGASMWSEDDAREGDVAGDNRGSLYCNRDDPTAGVG
jgi:hypothetical protein